MARPLDPAKRTAILNAAIHCIQQQGLHASTSAITREANVSAGTLFTYFPDKVTLLNCLLLELAGEMSIALMQGFPVEASIKDKAFHAWQAYVVWSRQHADRRHCVKQLMVSCFISEETHQAIQGMLKSVYEVLNELGASHHCSSVEFITAVMGSLAETTIDFVLREPEKERHYIEMGFYMFWQAAGMTSEKA
ncbi:TetR family transcriptional regulator [Enterobacteriaceae bacterium RIT691]|nr:TetR family transcriptional regulator [Enterobacteriaceae bacterium RIT691]